MKWLIIFPDPWLSYSPSILNFIKMLEINNQEYLIIYLDTSHFDNSKINFNAFNLKITDKQAKVLRILRIYKLYIFFNFIFFIKKNLRISQFDKIVGIDSMGYSIARIFNVKPIYYSLEISRSILNKIIFKYFKPNLLIIQSEERKNYLAEKFNNTLYIQNSPIVVKKLKKIEGYSGKLIYFGSIIASHGVELCLNALYQFNNETLTIKGSGNKSYIKYLKEKYSDLFSQKRVFIDTDYIAQDKIYDFLKDYDIGFCFYDLNIIGNGNFNYLSSPSGKIFNYMMCSIPVIGNDIVGLNIIRENNAGILLSEIEPRTIVQAVNDIQLNYHLFSENAYNLGLNFDYGKMFTDNWKKIKETGKPL